MSPVRRGALGAFHAAGLGLLLGLGLSACSDRPANSPYPGDDGVASTLYSSFSEQPKHLDPALSYSSNEYALIGQIYEPPLQYHYLKRPYQLTPLTLTGLPSVTYLDNAGNPLPADAPEERIAFSEYALHLRPDIRYQPHPAFAQAADGSYRYHRLSEAELVKIHTLADFAETGSRELTAEDYAYQIKRLVHPRLHSPIAELMKNYIAGLDDLAERLKQAAGEGGFLDLRAFPLEGVRTPDRHTLIIRVRGKYPQFRFWLAMPFFAPTPWEAERFYSQPGLVEKNLTLDVYPVGTGAFMLTENNPNRRMLLERNPNFHEERYPAEGEEGDAAAGFFADAGRRLPFIDRVLFTLEKETIPYWNKFLQGYYDASGIASDSFDQAVQFGQRGEAELTPRMREKNIRLQTSTSASIYYMGFNMLDPVVGGYAEARRKLRRALGAAVDYEEFIAIFLNGRGIPAQGALPPGLFGFREGAAGVNPYLYDWADAAARRKSIDAARRLLAEAGYPEGREAATAKPLVLYLDAAGGGADDKSLFNWYRKQFAKLGVQLVIRATDYNRFQQKMRDGNAQIFIWGWNADYPDPENFFFLLHGANAKVGKGGENAANYQNPEFDALFEKMRNMDDGPERQSMIDRLQEIVRRDAPWLFGFHPQTFALHHHWYRNLKPNQMVNNQLKYLRIDGAERAAARTAWNRPVRWPLGLLAALLAVAVIPAWMSYRRRARASAR
jgi:ABC-type transport system substrate-binding protein